MKWRWLVPLATIVFAWTLVVHTPAADAVAWLMPATSPIRAYGIEGTLGKGFVAALRYNDHPVINNVTWELHPLWLFMGRVALRLDGGQGNPSLHGNVQISPSTLRASGTVLDIQLKTLLANAGYGFLPVDGLLHLDLKRVQLSRTRIESLTANATVHSLRWDMGKSPLDLGDFSTHAASTDAGGVDAQLTSTSGPLEVSGSATLDANGHYTLDLKIKARPKAPAQVVDLLRQMGRPDTNGFHQIHYHGQAPWPTAPHKTG